MSKQIDLGEATAYAIAKKHGYVGTEVQFVAEMTGAAQSAREAAQDASDAEAYAIGKRDGTDVPSTDPAYHNNAKYYAEQGGAANLADAFSTSTAYAVDDYVLYNSKLWRFTTAHAAGAWNASHVAEVKTMDEVTDLKGDLSRLDGAVKYTSQTLTDSEKTIARDNISANKLVTIGDNDINVAEGESSGHFFTTNNVNIQVQDNENFKKRIVDVESWMKTIEFSFYNITGLSPTSIFCGFADANNGYISHESKVLGKQTLTIPSNAEYIYLSFWGADNTSYNSAYTIKGNQHELTSENIISLNTSLSNTVKLTEQSLTDEQKTQVKTNLSIVEGGITSEVALALLNVLKNATYANSNIENAYESLEEALGIITKEYITSDDVMEYYGFNSFDVNDGNFSFSGNTSPVYTYSSLLLKSNINKIAGTFSFPDQQSGDTPLVDAIVFKKVSDTVLYAINGNVPNKLLILTKGTEQYSGGYLATADNTIATLNYNGARNNNKISLELKNETLTGYYDDGNVWFSVTNANCIGFWWGYTGLYFPSLSLEKK